MADRDTVIITGFGPFRNHIINASWEVAKAVSELGIEEELGIRLITKEIRVSYNCVADEVPALWSEFKPILVIHLGLSRFAKALTIEAAAHKSGYCQTDVDGSVPIDGQCIIGQCDIIKTPFNLNQVVKDIRDSNIGVKIVLSHDAGRYLCEYIYYTSLCIDETCTLFVHVPDIDQPYSVQEMAQGIKMIIVSLLRQIRSKTNMKPCCEKQILSQ